MPYQMRPIPCKPYSLNWLPERLIVSHYENNYGAAVRSLNALRDRLGGMDPSATSPGEIRGLKREQQTALWAGVLPERCFATLAGARSGAGRIRGAALDEESG